jgi:IstB-like ATP binding protein
MINTENLLEPELEEISARKKFAQAYLKAGIPAKYHFQFLETAWSTEYSPLQKLTELGKKRSLFVKKFVGCYIDNIDKVISGAGIKYVKSKKIKFIKNIIFVGSNSSGKTLLLSLIAQSAVNKGYKTLFINWSEFLHKYQSYDIADEDEEYYQAALKCDLLLIDSVRDYDMSGTRNFQVLLDRLISYRDINDKITIVSIDTTEKQELPIYQFAWNQFVRHSPQIKLPEASNINEIKPKRT